MDRSDFHRCLGVTVAVALMGGLPAWPVLGAAWALGYTLAALWGALNLWALAQVLIALSSGAPRWRLWMLLVFKAAVLLGLGGALVLSPLFAPAPFLLGFHTVFVVILTLVISRALRPDPIRAEGSL